MDDTYLKTIFWAIIVLYTLAIIGIWENFIQPISIWSIQYIYPLLLAGWGNLPK